MPNMTLDTSSLGATTLVPSPGEFSVIQITGLDITSAGSVVVSLYSGVTLIWRTYSTKTAGGGIVLPISPDRQMVCRPGEPLVLHLSAAVLVGGSLTYTLIGSEKITVSLPSKALVFNKSPAYFASSPLTFTPSPPLLFILYLGTTPLTLGSAPLILIPRK